MLHLEDMHEHAMDVAEEAFSAQRKGRPAEAKRLFLRALSLESKAALEFSAEMSSEPTRSILFRSAAALAFHGGDFEQAERLVANGLAGFPPGEIKNELYALQEDIIFRRHILLQGAELAEQKMQMTLWGRAIGYGVIAADVLLKRIEQVKTLFYRTVERMSELPYRTAGRPPSLVTDHYGLFLEALSPGSFSVTFQIGQPVEQPSLFPELEVKRVAPAEIIDEVLSCFELLQNDESENLRNRFQDDNYYQNFLALARQMAPDGELIKGVGFASIYKGAERIVGLRKTRSEIDSSSEIYANIPDESRKSFRLEGELKLADSIKIKGETGMVKLVDQHGVPHSIRVPVAQMQDVVQPYFTEYVVVTGFKKRNALFLTDIYSADPNASQDGMQPVRDKDVPASTLFD